MHASIDNEKIAMAEYAVGTLACNKVTSVPVGYHLASAKMRALVDLVSKGGSELMAKSVKVDSAFM